MIEGIREKMEKYTMELVKIRSVVGSSGEREIAEYIYSRLSAIPYFRENPGGIYYHEIEGDPFGRKSVIALVRGRKGGFSRKTVVLLGHIDTVGVEDYGDLKGLSTDPEGLIEGLKQKELSREVEEDIQSGEWVFGRGIFDMKAGVAANMALIEEVSRRAEELEGNLVFLGVPDEEGNSSGMLSALKALKEMKQKLDLEYMAVIDTDYMAPRYEGDEEKYIYIGTVGKLLPCFYIVGKETHVGQAFEGLDPNMLASELLMEIDLSEDLCDIADGESTVPPISLKQQDLKEGYSVQTARSASLYFNYATHSQQPDEVLDRLVSKAERAFSRVIKRLNQNYRVYCQNSGIPYRELPWKPRVMTYRKLYDRVKQRLGDRLDKHIEDIKRQLLKDPEIDDRALSLRLVQEVVTLNPDKDPVIIVYFSPPYYPHIYVKGDTEKEKRLLDAVSKAIDAVKDRCPYRISTRRFYPYISDLSYCSITDDSKAIDSLIDNMPAWPDKYSLPIEDIRSLNAPVVNIGPFGKDAHKLTERLHKPYSFTFVPELLLLTATGILQGENR